MPSTFDAKGRPDIWNSEADTLASIASYLADYGWVKGRDWGFEVTVPENVSCALEGPGPRQEDRRLGGARYCQGRRQAVPQERGEGGRLSA